MMNKIMRALAGILAAALMAAGPAALVLAPLAAVAQSSPGFVNNPQLPPPTAAEWNGYFSGKTDYLPGATNALAYWNGSRKLVSAPASGDCSATAAVFRCTKLAGVAPGNIFGLNAGTGTSIAGGNLNVTNAVPSNLTITTPASAATLTIAGGKTITLSNTITFTAVDGSTLAIGSGGTLGPLAYAPASLSANGTLVTDGSSVPSISQTLPSAVQGNITAVGSISSGTWGGTAVGATHGGTGLTAGTSGGVPYFSSTTTIASSAALTANLPVIGGGAGAAPAVGTRSGNTTSFATTTGALTSGHVASFDASGNIQDGGPSPSGPGSSLVSTQAAAGVTNLVWTGLSATPNTFELKCDNIASSVIGTTYKIQVGTGGTPTYQTSGYHSQVSFVVNGSAASQASDIGTDGVYITNSQGVDNAANGGMGKFDVNMGGFNNTAASSVKLVDFKTATNGSPGGITESGSGLWNGVTAVTAIKLITGNGTSTFTGTCSLYQWNP